MTGGASQCDLFDYKPLLIQRHGQAFDRHVEWERVHRHECPQIVFE